MSTLIAVKDAERDAVAAVADGFTTAWNTHDLDAFGRLFADDAEFVNVAGMWWRGRPQIQGVHAHTHATFMRDSVLKSAVASLKFLSPEVALVHVSWTLTGHREPNGETGAPRVGVLVLVAVRTPEGWRIASAQNGNELPEARARMLARARPGHQSRSSSLSEVLLRVCSSTRLTMTAQ